MKKKVHSNYFTGAEKGSSEDIFSFTVTIDVWKEIFQTFAITCTGC